ncbi:hypothetical protein CORT_0B07780 [Candida orthopsilosis Co 90-125]|uniref:Uncharacterized protein n=1 Tax=Candida orthopsilosis (strain 90-125) TaxID=1136231 RepID=H8X1S8_CANO9|nr:hypothetical protein CORT_0B07780 [Candida orthopsilosis Co 90-125]CCG22483.1 hypothetical protein CORT_0B07780 [Candida orthopsilosis Co 90-125]
MELVNNDEQISALLDTSLCFEQIFPQLSIISSLTSSATNNTPTQVVRKSERGNSSPTEDFAFDCEQFTFSNEMINEYASNFQWIKSLDDEWSQPGPNSKTDEIALEPPSVESTSNNSPSLESLLSQNSPTIYSHPDSAACMVTESNNMCHRKTLSLASPLQMPDEEDYLMPTFKPISNKRRKLTTNECQAKRRLSLSLSTKSKSFDANHFKGNDIFTYKFCNKSKPQQMNFRISKSTKENSQLLRPPLKPSVTITSIDTLSRTRQPSCPTNSASRIVVTPHNNSTSASVSSTSTIIYVGNPFYKPFHGNARKPSVNRYSEDIINNKERNT